MSPKQNNLNGPGHQSYLKRRNAGYLWSFVGANLAVFLSVFITKGFSSSSITHLWKGVTTKNGVIATCIPLLTIVLSGLIDDQMKARLVFWRWRNPLPGCRAFSELIRDDPRIDVPLLRKLYGEFPRNPKQQNTLWYHLYKKHTESVVVSEAHRNYLLTRDMTALSGVFLVLFSAAIGLDSVPWKVACLYLMSLAAQYLIIAISAQNYGKRFVLNVLAEESHNGPSPSVKTGRRQTPDASESA
jgi:hypothetical protein